jgi:hypothetical protein
MQNAVWARLKDHARHSSTNYIMNLMESILAAKERSAWPGNLRRLRMQSKMKMLELEKKAAVRRAEDER